MVCSPISVRESCPIEFHDARFPEYHVIELLRRRRSPSVVQTAALGRATCSLSRGKLPGAKPYGGEEIHKMMPYFQPERTTVRDHLSRRSKELPTKRRNLVAAPGRIEGGSYKQARKVVGQNANPEKHRVGAELTAGHTLHAEADLQLLDPVLAMLAPLIVPLQHLFRRSVPVRGNRLVAYPGVGVGKRSAW